MGCCKSCDLVLTNQSLLLPCSIAQLSFLKNRPIPASFLFIFVLFSLQFQYKLKMVCLGSKPGTQDGRRRRNHGAMAATYCSTQFRHRLQRSVFIKHFWVHFDLSCSCGFRQIKTCSPPHVSSVTRFGNFLDFGQLFEAFGSN